MKNQQQRTIGKNQKNRKMFGIALFLTFFCIFVLFVVRFFVIATTKDVQNRNLQTMASRMYTSKRIIEAKRGTIYDAQGNALAQDTKTYTVTAVLSHQSLTAKGKPNYVTNKKKQLRSWLSIWISRKKRPCRSCRQSARTFTRLSSVRLAAVFQSTR